MAEPLDWKAVLADLRAHLPPAGAGRGLQKGSLRWLEGQMRQHGGNPAALRNIIYRDTGTQADKRVLTAILSGLAQEAGRSLALPEVPAPPPTLPDELELLGRTKKRIYKQFTASIRAGRFPKLVVGGRAGSGKTVLLEHIALALQQSGVVTRRVNLSGDVLGSDQAGAEQASTSASGGKGGAGRGRSYAELADLQGKWLRSWLPASGALLLRVTADLRFGGDPPRRPSGQVCTPAEWVYERVMQPAPAPLALLVALEDAAGWPQDAVPLEELRPPTIPEARSYLIQKLGVSRETADQFVRETGRNLDRLALLAGAGGDAAHLLTDPDLRRAAGALAAMTLHQPQGAYPAVVWQALLGMAPAQLPVHVRSQLEPQGQDWAPRPALRQAVRLLPASERLAAIQALARQEAADAPEVRPEMRPFWLAALAELGDWNTLTQHVRTRPDDARFLPALWPAVRSGAPGAAREALARLVVTHYTGRGEYHSPRARDALFVLLESDRRSARVWARVKLAESSVDAGNFEAAQEQLLQPEVQQTFAAQEQDDWALSAHSDALLVQAALARWRGDMGAATLAVSDPRTAQSGPRAELWRGLIAKDAGRWPEALTHLQAVPQTSPLLSARARYQEGDLRLRIGQPLAALEALQEAARRLEEAGGTGEELARILARSATAQRRLGHPLAGLSLMERALAAVPAEARTRADGVPRARLISENIPILLALNRPQEALAQGAQALALLELPGPRRAEAEYRTRRTRYRVALAYLTRGIGVPYLQPFSGAVQDNPDLAWARELLNELLRRPAGESDREQVLLFDMHLSRALVEVDPGRALEHVALALNMTDHPYAETQARAIRAEALLRSGQPEAALTEINRAHRLLRRVQLGAGGSHAADPGLLAQLLALEARATIGEGVKTLFWLREAVQDPALRPFTSGLWRDAGLALERHHPAPRQVLLAFEPRLGTWPMRPPDALTVWNERWGSAGG